LISPYQVRNSVGWCEALTKWLALVEVDEESGCVRYVRDSHKRTVTLGFSQGIVEFPNSEDKAAQAAYQLKLIEDLKSSEKIWRRVHARSKSLVG
jgi:ectoine hydroxylase-related dioxygenase (phytanoyl-CoA dioxygenase family)